MSAVAACVSPVAPLPLLVSATASYTCPDTATIVGFSGILIAWSTGVVGIYYWLTALLALHGAHNPSKCRVPDSHLQLCHWQNQRTNVRGKKHLNTTSRSSDAPLCGDHEGNLARFKSADVVTIHSSSS